MKTLVIRALLALLVAFSLGACTQMPTEKAGVVDLRPQISFRIVNEALTIARVSVDGIDVGPVSDFLSGAAALRVLSGTHRVVVSLDTAVFLDEKVYLGDGVSRTFIVK